MEHKYDEFEMVVDGFFADECKSNHLFTTNAEGLFEAYLAGIPEENRQHYNCNSCKHFINLYGGLVTIDQNGEINSAVWSLEKTPEFFKKSVKNMLKIVDGSKVNGVFVGKNNLLGTAESNGWTHLHAHLCVNLVNTSPIKTAGQVMAERKEERRILAETIAEFDKDTASKAATMLTGVYRSDRFIEGAKWLVGIYEKKESLKPNKFQNYVWLLVAKSPTLAHIKSTVVGNMLTDIKDNLSTDSILARFNAMVNPGSYMRSQSDPTERQVENAEQIVKKLGLERSLERRYARFDEIPEFVWKPAPKKENAEGGVFGKVKAKVVITPEKIDDMPKTTMTWSKFLRTVVPSAKNIEAVVNPGRFMAIVAPKNEDAPNILQWENGYSWYYHGGVDGEMRRRVMKAGGIYDNAFMRCTLMWNTRTDLDVHCQFPNGHIFYGNKKIGSGWLDVDMNVGGETTEPVENIRWNTQLPTNGHYNFYVHTYRDRAYGDNPYTIELQVGDKVFKKTGVASTYYQQTEFEFDYYNGQIHNANFNMNQNFVVPGTGNFVKVTGITKSPNLWGEKPYEHGGNHVFFLLEGMKDQEEGKGRGFFNEMLKTELREIRKTLEAYTATTAIEGADTADACGVGYAVDNDWNLTLRVDDGVSVRLYLIDRYE